MAVHSSIFVLYIKTMAPIGYLYDVSSTIFIGKSSSQLLFKYNTWPILNLCSTAASWTLVES